MNAKRVDPEQPFASQPMKIHKVCMLTSMAISENPEICDLELAQRRLALTRQRVKPDCPDLVPELLPTCFATLTTELW